MYEILEDGRVALDPTAPNDRLALSVYADLLRHDNRKMGGEEPLEFEKVLKPSLAPGVHHIIRDSSDEKDMILKWLSMDGIEIVKLVVRDLKMDETVVESVDQQEKGDESEVAQV